MRVSVGDASLTNILARQGADLRGQVQRAAQEVASGKYADIGATLRGDFSPLLAIDASLSRLSAYRSTATDGAVQAAAQQSAIAGLSQLASGISTALMGARYRRLAALFEQRTARAELEHAAGRLTASSEVMK